mgnify:CR=1 FL=1|tara:strand:- start:831 stop:1028 length:198 start_codon:yes stop_codon:yes gene_type:complete
MSGNEVSESRQVDAQVKDVELRPTATPSINLGTKGAFQTNPGCKNSSMTNCDLHDNIRPKLNFAE